MNEDDIQIFKGSFFEVLYPAHWNVEVIEQIPAFYDPEGSGALQLVASQGMKPGFDPAIELRNHLNRQKVDISKIEFYIFDDAGKECVACEYFHDGRFWMMQMTSYKEKMILFMYNSDETPEPGVALSLSKIIRSVRFNED